MFKVQFYHVRIVEIGREIVAGTRTGAHVGDGISHFRRQAGDTFRTPDWIVSNRTAASERGSTAKLRIRIAAPIAESGAPTLHMPVFLPGGRRRIPEANIIRTADGRQ
jgi:hypothetical protein